MIVIFSPKYYIFNEILGVQISSVHFFVHLFQMNEDQLKYCPSLPTTFFYLSGNFRIPSRKNDSSVEAIQF